MGEAKRRSNYRAARYAVEVENRKLSTQADETVDHKAAKRSDAAKRAAATRARNKLNK